MGNVGVVERTREWVVEWDEPEVGDAPVVVARAPLPGAVVERPASGPGGRDQSDRRTPNGDLDQPMVGEPTF